MSAEYKHDPVRAISEAEAAGAVAECFADIRETMNIPWLTSIWRVLAGNEEDLFATWNVVKPLYIGDQKGYPDANLGKLRSKVDWPMPTVVLNSQASAVRKIVKVIEAYNRSNTLIMITLSSLIEPAKAIQIKAAPDPLDQDWADLPPLLEKEEIADDLWILLEELNQFGSLPDQPGMASLWRHLAHWPSFLSSTKDALSPLQESGRIDQSIRQLLAEVKVQAGDLANHHPETLELPSHVKNVIKSYVEHPGLVARMVVIGHSLSEWLRKGKHG